MENAEDVSRWKGSAYTAASVKGQIAERWGEEAAKEYDPLVNCFTFKGWKARGYSIKKGEKSLKSFSFVNKSPRRKDGSQEPEERVKKFPVTVHLFWKDQVHKRFN